MDEASEPLVKKIDDSRDELMSWLASADFYVEMLAIGFAVAIAFLLAILIKRRVTAYLRSHPPKRFDTELFTRPLALLPPLFILMLLSAMLPLAKQHHGGIFIDGFIQLSLAWLGARAILLAVRSRFVAIMVACVIMLITVLSVTGFLASTVEYLQAISFEIGKFKLTMLNLLQGIVILVVVFWLAGATSRTLEGYLRRSSSMNYSTRELIVKFFNIFIYFVAILITLSAVGVDLTAFAVFGGALGVGIGLGLQKITANFVSGITLLMEKSIKIGDLIEVGTVTGWVRQLNIRYALLETADGREVLIPNEELISTRVINWTYSNDQARVEIKINVDYDADTALAKKLLLEAALENKHCIRKPEPTCWLREFGDSGLLFMLTFWISDIHEGRNGPQSEVMFAILEKFRTNNIVIPYPHQVSITPPPAGTA